MRALMGVLLAALLTGCVRNAPPPTFTAAPTLATLAPTPTALETGDGPPAPTNTPSPVAYTDVRGLFAGLCFESVYDAAGQVFVLRDAEALAELFSLADNSGLCAQPVARAEADWADGAVIAGLWSRGTGCTARHVVSDAVRDDANRRIALTVRLETRGDCPYELVEPFWVRFENAPEYEVLLLQ